MRWFLQNRKTGDEDEERVKRQQIDELKIIKDMFEKGDL